jgi:modified peptide precursor CbpA
MAKGSGGPSWSFGALFAFSGLHASEANVKKTCKTAKATTKAKAGKKSVIASRKSCSATGTGLSHYILTDRKAK